MSAESTHFICIGCPMGCPLELVHEGDRIEEVSGNECNRGAKYARQEFIDPRRTFSTTVVIEGAHHPRLPVKLTSPVPKERIMDAVAEVHRIRATAPVTLGQVLATDILGEQGIDVVACCTMARV